ncbi:MAG: type VI secretion IcmF C-terminal domain-containing protein, partial [Acidobacteriota bacterium]|nr:type VI secretion IcmF C-terminal domain-containing protein [Acidobacteriota bacterium]
GQVIAGLADRANGAAGGSLAPMLRSAYRGEVVAVCQTVMGRYPFAAGSTTDVSLNEFGRVFGHGGAYDRFFNQQLETLVDRSRSPWRWRPNSGLGREREMLNRFEEADRIRDLFFSPGGSLPELRFTVTLVELDDPIDRFVLEVDGQPMDYLRGSVRSSAPMMWPGPSPGRTAITFDTSRTEYLGDWSWFKMVDAARAQRETGTRYVLSAESGRSSARMRVDTESIRNPFEGVQRLRRFSCGS